MVVKRQPSPEARVPRFESRVILDGSQTLSAMQLRFQMFESRVILDGSQTSERAKVRL